MSTASKAKTGSQTFAGAFGLQATQHEVDFVIPRLDRDLPLCIDPFLLYRSRRPELREAHALLISVFDAAFQAFRDGNNQRARDLVDFPEARAIRLGYASNSDEGRGIGKQMGPIFVGALEESPDLVKRGFKHVEELQLLAEHIGPDRISDLAGNVLRGFLAKYTKEQAELWGMPLTKGVPLEHVWDLVEGDWVDDFADLLTDPANGRPVMLVPRWIVRQLPWINYQDFKAHELRAFLGPKSRSKRFSLSKPEAVKVSRQNIALVDRYVARKEKAAAGALPTERVEAPVFASAPYLAELKALSPGIPDAKKYEALMLRIFNALFEPKLTDGKPQSRTAEGTEIRDLVYVNSMDDPWLRAVHRDYGNFVMIFECKNVAALDVGHVNQLATYLGDATGRFAFLVTRTAATASIAKKIRAVFNKQFPRRLILVISDREVEVMLKAREAGQSPIRVMQRLQGVLLQQME